LERKYVYAAALCFLVALAALLVLYNNLSSVDATLGSAVVSHVGLHRAEGAQTYFFLVVSVKNPSLVPVTMSFEGTERYLLETIWVLKGTTRSLGLQSSGRKTLENTTGWWYQIGS